MLSRTLFLMIAALCAGGAATPLKADVPLIPDSNRIRLDEIGLYAVGLAYRGKAAEPFPTGWTGFFEDRTGIACRPYGTQNGRAAFLLHCPWRGGTGIAYQQFTFRLPRARRILLRGATAMQADIVGKSDGATFRVFVNGRKLLETHRADAEWKPFTFDLTAYAGKTAILRFETDPGPKDDPSFDYSLWGDRELILEGYMPKQTRRPDPPPLRLERLASSQTGSVVPPVGFTAKTALVREADDRFAFRYSGEDGALTYLWQMPKRPEDPLFGRLVLQAKMRGDTPVNAPLANGARLEWTQPARPTEVRWRRERDEAILTRAYRIGAESVEVEVRGRMNGKSLVLQVRGPARISRLEAGSWGPAMRRKVIPVPYYSGQVTYLPSENLFVHTLLDWLHSSASAHDGVTAHYGALTDGSRNPLQERIVYTAAWHLAETLPNIPNPPSPYRPQIADRIVLDIWGGRYADIAKDLARLHDYGITRCIALIHDWQRSGYDNALPMHIPAAADKGGDEGMKVLIGTGTRLGYIMTLHENYVDYYPNYDHFNEDDIALDSEGKRQLAWYNAGTKIQSFAVKPNAILSLAATQSPEIHRRYGTNGCYLDVHSAVPPWFHVDFRAGEEGAGTFRRVWEAHRALWEYERRTHGGPVFGEGNSHWYWSGLLDGVEAQFGTGWPGMAGMTAPLMADFDLLKIQPLQFNHGMGYYERWWSSPSWRALPPMVVLDQYRMQEVVFGHAGFLGASTWNVLPLAWLEHHLLSPVMARYAATPVVGIEYEVNGRWADATAAAKAGIWSRARIRYANGLTITANDRDAPLQVGGITLPRFGWIAEGAGVRAYTALRDGVVADCAETADSLFVNARPAADWNLSGVRKIRPTVAQFAQPEPRVIQFAYAWQVQEALEKDYHCFVHFGKPGAADSPESILFQQDHPLPEPTSRWQIGQTVMDGPYTLRLPDGLPDGEYEWTIGLFSVGAGRVALEGMDDGQRRIRLGTLRVRDQGRAIAFEPERRSGAEQTALYQQRLNRDGRVVDFGAVRTNGSLLLRREGDDWTLQTLPREKAFIVQFSVRRFPPPARVRCVDGETETVAPQTQGEWWTLPLNGAKAYRWSGRGR
jgi:hypothetical protein